jgi:hypothetical protein
LRLISPDEKGKVRFMEEVMAELGIIQLLAAAVFIASVITAVKTILTFTKSGKEKFLKPVIEKVERLEFETKKQDLLILIDTQPTKVDIIESVYDNYKKLGGNSYMDSLIAEWRDIYEKDIIRHQLEKGE